MADRTAPRLAAWLALALLGGACAAGTTTEPLPSTTSQLPEITTTSTFAPTTSTTRRPSGPATMSVVTLEVGGVERTYALHVPSDLPAEGAALVVDLHGLGSTPETHDEASQMRALAQQEGFVVAQPAARGDLPTWNPQPDEPGSTADVAFIRALVDDVAQTVPIDPSAVFASGFSNGGGMAHRLACDAADVFAAVGTVSGQYPMQDVCDPAQPVALVTFHGTTDLIVPYRGVGRLLPDITTWVGEWAERLDCSPVPERERVAEDVISDRWSGCGDGVEVLFFTIEGGAHSWPGSMGESFFNSNQSVDATRVMWQFFNEHRR